ncbi:MAG: nitroreductase family protein [Gammaproteobacteria bacterium]|nr:nitroreductase family protein [Gammaproteobacteria bacterium]
MALETLEAIRTRRVAKYYDQNKSVSDDLLWTILEAARWAPTGGNERVHHFICLTEKSLIKKIKLFFPGMVAGTPSALIFICINWNLVLDNMKKRHPEVSYDVGHYSQNMLLAAHALGLAAGPMSSFSKEAICILLNTPDGIDPRFCIGIGHPAKPPAHMPSWPKKKLKVESLVQWGGY